MRRAFALGLALLILTLALDQAAKLWVERAFALGESLPLLPVLNLTYVRNQGAAWGLFQGAQTALAAFGAIAIALCCVFWKKIFGPYRWAPPLMGLLFGGILGNLVDRLRLGYVVDFVDCHWGGAHFPCFNVADAAICLSVAALVVLQWVADRRAARAAREEPR